jgi:beta-galactosidase GanA
MRSSHRLEQILSYYAPLRRFAQPVDIVSATAPLEKYKLVIAPGLNILPAQIAQHLTEWHMPLRPVTQFVVAADAVSM